MAYLLYSRQRQLFIFVRMNEWLIFYFPDDWLAYEASTEGGDASPSRSTSQAARHVAPPIAPPAAATPVLDMTELQGAVEDIVTSSRRVRDTLEEVLERVRDAGRVRTVTFRTAQLRELINGFTCNLCAGQLPPYKSMPPPLHVNKLKYLSLLSHTVKKV